MIIFLNLTFSLKMSLKNTRNEFKTCSTGNNCDECREDGQFKSCVHNTCYCCNMDEKCQSQNSK